MDFLGLFSGVNVVMSGLNLIVNRDRQQPGLGDREPFDER